MFCQDLELQVALTGRKKPVLGQKKATNNFFDADHHFEPHKIGFKNFDQQSDTARPRDTRILVPEKNRAAQNRTS